MTLQTYIYVFDEVEVLDFAGPFEVFSTAARMYSGRDASTMPLFRVSLVSVLPSVRARGGLRVIPDLLLDQAGTPDVLIVPGGVVTAELERGVLIDWIRGVAPKTKITASVCTGVFLLAKAGLTAGRTVTTHWEDVDELRTTARNLTVQEGVRWVDEGPIVTSAGISAGIDMSLHLVERLAGRGLAERTARQMEFDWTERTRSPEPCARKRPQ